ncbi:MAG: hypothetical protein WCV83_02295 [Candidatus Magasanikbacteria bacterium]|jgi:hypothetical protein
MFAVHYFSIVDKIVVLCYIYTFFEIYFGQATASFSFGKEKVEVAGLPLACRKGVDVSSRAN